MTIKETWRWQCEQKERRTGGSAFGYLIRWYFKSLKIKTLAHTHTHTCQITNDQSQCRQWQCASLAMKRTMRVRFDAIKCVINKKPKMTCCERYKIKHLNEIDLEFSFLFFVFFFGTHKFYVKAISDTIAGNDHIHLRIYGKKLSASNKKKIKLSSDCQI